MTKEYHAYFEKLTGARTAIYGMYFLSGVAALCLQVVWFKQLKFVLGSSTFSVSVTVASFFFGLSVGSYWGGFIASKTKQPLQLYAVLEAILGLVAVGITYGLSDWNSWMPLFANLLHPESASAIPVTVLIAFISLLPATMLMGATMPLLARWVVDQPGMIARRIGDLYAVNTLGAAVGCMLVGFFAIGLLGVTLSAHCGTALYLGISATAWYLSVKTNKLASTANVALEKTEAHADNPKLLAIVFAISGFIAIAYEILWFRGLSGLGQHSVYAFSGMLTVYLLGLVGGALICARKIAPKKSTLLPTFALIQALTASAAVLSVAILGRGGNIMLWAEKNLPFPISLQLWMGEAPTFFVVCGLVVLPPTLLLGICFPLASELTIRELGQVSKRVGSLYALNTLGGVLGSLTAGFILLPRFGSQTSFSILIAGNLLLSIILVVSQTRLRTNWILIRQITLASIMCVVGIGLLGQTYMQDAFTNFQGAEIKRFRETKDATYVVLEYGKGINRYQQLLVNGKSYANNRPEGRRYMAALAHLPVLMHPNPSDALVICIGTGTTVGALTRHKELKSITAVDLANEVFAAARHFVPINHSFFENPNVKNYVADGRHFLLTETRQWDIMTFEPPPPHDAGIVNLYSEDFYKIARSHLTNGGIIAQWMPLDIARGEVPKQMIRAMMANFRYVSLWIPNRMEGIALASDKPLQINVQQLTQRMAAPKVAADLQAVGLEKPEHLLGAFVAANEALEKFVGKGPSVTDDHPTIEYHNFLPEDPIYFEDILVAEESITNYLTGDIDLTSLALGKKVMHAIWAEHEAGVFKHENQQREAIEAALSINPNNNYLIFLEKQLK